MELDGARDTFLTRLNKTLESGWQCRLNQDGRLYYLNHNNKTSQWIPPRSNWPLVGDLPFGWESARDKNGKDYYINHRSCTTTQDDPFDLEEAPPEQRDVVLVRDTALGFGFIAGSERPVVIRSVTEGGPSIEKLLPGDEIMRVNGEDVKNSDRQYIIDKIRYSTEEIALTVIQPYIDKTGLKSSFLSATKKQKLKAKPPRVRFAENVNTFPSNSPKIPPSLVYLPNVLKVYLENGQTKSFKYNDDTTVMEVLVNLQEKLGLKCLEYFSLAVEDVRVPSLHKFIVLQEHEALRQIAERPGSQNWKCHLRITYIPCDAYDLLNEDPQAFQYFFQQCCNDVLSERFSSELKPDMAMRLASLHIHQYLLANKQTTKGSIKTIEKEDGLDRFLPKNVLSNWKIKELRKMINHHMKQNQNLTAPGQKQLTELQAQLHYLKIIGGLKSFGTRTFLTTILDFPDVDQQSDATVIVGPHCDVSLLAKTGDRAPVLEFNQLTRILLTVESGTEDGVHRLELHQKSGQPIVFLMPTEDAQQMASFINGYYRLLVNRKRTLLTETSFMVPSAKAEAPPYYGKHHVQVAKWNYPDDLASEVISRDVNSGDIESAPKRRRMGEGERWVDLAAGPPQYEPDHSSVKRQIYNIQEEPESTPDQHDNREEVEVHVCPPGEDETDKPAAEHLSEYLDDASPLSEDSQLSEEKADSEKEKEILSLLSSGPSSPESDGSSSGISSTSASNRNDNRKKEAKPGKSGAKKRDKSLTEGISKKIFRSITGMKFNVKDTVASNDSEYVTATEVKFLSSSPVQDHRTSKSASPVTDSEPVSSPESSPVEDNKTEERPNSRLRARDSILIQHKKMSPRLQKRRGSDEGEYSDLDEDGQSKSFDSDIIDLTNIGDFDFDSDNSPTKSMLDGNDDVFLVDGEVPDEEESTQGVKFHLGDEEVHIETKLDGVTPNDVCEEAAEMDDSQTLSNESEEEIDFPDSDGEECDGFQGSEEQGLPDEEDDDEDDIPMSIIDSFSPERTLRTPVETSDEAHGMQLAALVALNASLEEASEPLQAAAKSPDTECESDSGNETISSEIDNNNADHVGVSQSPRDYVQFSKASNFEHSLDGSMDHESSSTISVKDEDIQEPYSGAAGCATSSDTESTSTLHGSSPNLSAVDLGEDKAMLPPAESSKHSAEVGGYVDDIEALIATLVVPPPPLLASGDVDEELLQAILPPPTWEGCDEGTIGDVLHQDFDTIDADDAQMEMGRREATSPVPGAKVDESVDHLATIINLLKLPPEGEEPDLNNTEDVPDSASPSFEMNWDTSQSFDEADIVHPGVERPESRHSLVNGIHNEELGSEMGDLEEEAGLRELLELTVTNGEVDEYIDEDGTVGPIEDVTGCLAEDKDIENGLINDALLDREVEEDKLISAQVEVQLDNEEEEAGDLEVHYDSYGRLRGQKSPEKKVADILDAIILGSMSPSVSSSTASTPSVDRPSSSLRELDSQPGGIQQSKLQGSVDSGFHQPDQDQLSLTSPSETISQSIIDKGYPKEDQKKEDPAFVVEDEPPPETQQEVLRIQEPTVEVPVVRPKHPGGKPNVPPKPPKPARPKNLKLILNNGENDVSPPGLRKSNKYPAPQPPQAPPRKRYTAPGIAAKASRFESGSPGEPPSKGKSDRFATLPKSFSPPEQLENNFDFETSVPSKPDFIRVHSDEGTNVQSSIVNGDVDDPNGRRRKGEPIARSHTFSDSSPTKETNKLFPLRKAPPPPLPKPKIESVHLTPVLGKSSKSKESTSATNSPRGSVSKKPSFSGSLSKLLSPHKSKTWGQFKGALPFKQGSFKGNAGSSRSKSKSRKPLKALWPSATCDDPEDLDNNAVAEGSDNKSVGPVSLAAFQRSESAEFETRPDFNVQMRVRSFSMNLLRNNSEDSTSESDYDTPQGSPNLSQGGTLRGRPSSMISLTESYPPAFDHPRRPPPPRPSNPPVLKAASLSKLSTKMYIKSGPISPIPPSSPAVSPDPVPSPSGSIDDDSLAVSPTPPPLPSTKPPDFGQPDGGSLSDDDDVNLECTEEETNAIVAIESRDYAGVTAISRAISDIEILADGMNDSTANLQSLPNARQFRQAKDTLLSEVREFTSNTKMVVSAAGQAGEQLRESTNSSMHTLARLCSATQSSMTVMSSSNQAQNLGKKVEDVARNFGATLQAANEAHGKALSDPKMQQLLRKAQTMAALLSALMRSLRMLQH